MGGADHSPECSDRAVVLAGAMDADTPESSSARFEQWVVPEVEVLLRVARSMTRSTHDAEDLVQDTMLRAYRSIDRFDGRYPRAWLLTIMRNAEINRHRRQRPSLLTAAQQTLPDPVADGGATAESTVIDLTFDDAVDEAFEHLSADFQEVIELVDIGGLTYAEAARVAGVPEGTVMSRLHRARQRVRARLERHGYDAGRPR
jgi:RNA polymerase sigma-70 factor, ECF subfamily